MYMSIYNIYYNIFYIISSLYPLPIVAPLKSCYSYGYLLSGIKTLNLIASVGHRILRFNRQGSHFHAIEFGRVPHMACFKVFCYWTSLIRIAHSAICRYKCGFLKYSMFYLLSWVLSTSNMYRTSVLKVTNHYYDHLKHSDIVFLDFGLKLIFVLWNLWY